MPDDFSQLDLFTPAPSPPARHFLDWSRPLLETAAEWLLDRAKSGGILDLSALLVIVPTRNAGRRLREMLANLANERGTAVIPPLAAPPSILTRPEDGAADLGRPIAGNVESMAAWIAALEGIDLKEYRALFPIDPPARDFSWAHGTARDLSALRRTLGESGLSLGDLTTRLPEGHEERERWQDLARLEREWLRRLDRGLHRCDREQARALAARRARLPEATREVVLIGTPDPFPLALDALENLRLSGTPISVLIHAPLSLERAFDSWGRPEAEFWLTEPIEIPDFAETIEIVANPDALVTRVTEAVTAIREPAETLAIGAIDSELAPLLESALRERGVPAFCPEGGKVKREGFFHLLTLLGRLLTGNDFPALRELLRVPEVGAWLAGGLASWDGRAALRALDDSHSTHLATDLPGIIAFLRADAGASERSEWEREQRRAGEFSQAAEAVDRIRGLLDQLGRGSLSDSLPPILRDLIGSRPRRGESGWWSEKTIEAAAAPLMDGLAQIDTILRSGIKLKPADQLTLLLEQVGETPLSEDRPPLAIELQGWLELLWEDAPHLILAGLNDGIVPEAIVGHPYLPENLRSLRTLRLPTNDDRLVRDLYHFRALLENRLASGGRLDVLVPKTSATGDPLRPSRLLFRCRDEELPARVRQVFREAEAPGTQASWSPGFLLVPNAPRDGAPERPVEKIAVTAFADYLSSPFHFWAGRLRRMSEVDPSKAEMDDLDFGNFCHQVLEAFGHDRKARDLTDGDALEAWFLDQADRFALEQFGPRPGLAVRIQLQSAKARLRAAAHIQAAERAAGWEIISVEEPLAEAYPLTIGGLAISGKIDRVERNGHRYRVIDYKTSDSPPKGGAQSDHCVNNRLPDDAPWPPEYAFFERGEKRMRWKKLQLPLYCLALADRHPEAELTCGYFHLAKAVSQVTVDAWEMDEAWLEAARTCAEGVVADVLAGKFSHLVPRGDRDWLGPLHLGLPEKTLDLTFVGGDNQISL